MVELMPIVLEAADGDRAGPPEEAFISKLAGPDTGGTLAMAEMDQHFVGPPRLSLDA